jgi:hypothetical protein
MGEAGVAENQQSMPHAYWEGTDDKDQGRAPLGQGLRALSARRGRPRHRGHNNLGGRRG